MENNLLFVNHNPEIIEEFLDAMKEYNLDIDTADSGLEAAVLLKKKTYKVVITGVNLPTYDGTKLIAYLNQRYPQTVCIVYTRRVELAHLKLLVNEREVFRIFQKPADYQGEMYEAILDGFTCYDNRMAKIQEKQILEQKLESAARNMKEMEQAVAERTQEKKELVKYLQSLLKVFVHDMESQLPEKEKWQLIQYENKVLSWLVGGQTETMESLEEARQKIYEEFLCPEQQQRVEIKTELCMEPVSRNFCSELYFIMRLVMTRFAMVSSIYEVEIDVLPMNSQRYRVRVEGVFPEGVWSMGHEQKLVRIITEVTQTILETFAARFTQSISDEKIVYYLEPENSRLSIEIP